NKGVVYDVIGNPWQAIKEYDTVVMKDPKLAKAYYNRGASYEKVAKYDEAIVNYKKAMELNPMYRNELEIKVDFLNYEYR
ncbi:MAG: tetratricopeptide repeat protein, partial [Ignavibacteria bacterium]|nr:tetratricopeptide repeat protein [Ignavibacteria bacterium]